MRAEAVSDTFVRCAMTFKKAFQFALIATAIAVAPQLPTPPSTAALAAERGDLELGLRDRAGLADGGVGRARRREGERQRDIVGLGHRVAVVRWGEVAAGDRREAVIRSKPRARSVELPAWAGPDAEHAGDRPMGHAGEGLGGYFRASVAGVRQPGLAGAERAAGAR